MLATRFLNLELKNPVTTGAGTFGYGHEMSDFIDVSALGAIVVKGTSYEPWKGNPPPRIYETPCGMLNSIGLQNEGLEYFIEHKMPYLRSLNTHVIVGVFDKTSDNYARICAALDKVKGIAALELNLSCPNIEAGGVTFCVNIELMREVITKARRSTSLPMLAKLSPNVTDIVEIAKTAVSCGVDGLTLINTVLGMAIDTKNRRPVLNTNVGGFSGPAILPIAVANIWKVRRTLPETQILGIGGVHDADSALQLMLAGANIVGVGTANFYNPKITMEIIKGLEEYCIKDNIENIQEIVGKVRDY